MIYQIIEFFNDFFGYDDLKKKHTKEFLKIEEYDCNLKIKSLDDWYSQLTKLIKSYCNYWAMDDITNKQIKEFLYYIYKKKYHIYNKMLNENENKNRGTGAGGKNTNMNGKNFEDRTSNYDNLIKDNFQKIKINDTKFGYYLYKKNDDCEIYYCKQSGLKSLLKEKFSLTIFRVPDEAYIIIKNNGEKFLVIIEQKNQNGEGSVETKLWAAPALKREYEISLKEQFRVYYTFIFNIFYENKIKSDVIKYKILLKIFLENNINYFYGEEEDYFNKFNEWLNKI
jgi:hypothetical protein